MVQLRYYQDEAATATVDYLLNKPAWKINAAGAYEPVNANPVVAMPTGTGKSIVIGDTCKRLIDLVPSTRFLMATDSKELVRQNAEEMLEIWPDAPIGIVSAGLRQRQLGRQITYGGIGTLIGAVEDLGRIDFVGIDEAHMVSDKEQSNYQKLIAELRKVNPYVRTIGWSATYWRQGSGLLTDGTLFTDIVYNNCTLEQFNRLIAEGYLAPLVVRPTQTELQTDDVQVLAGEFNQKQLQNAVNDDKTTRNALWETVQAGWDRQAWLVFTAGVEHTENVARILTEFGVDCAPVHSKRPSAENDANIAKFKAGQLRAIVGNNMFVKGFNYRPVDLIACLRPTKSTALWVQMLGRGTRPSLETGKRNCLVLDFAQNAKSLGPINDPVIPKKRQKGDPGEMPVKICSACGCYNHARAVVCEVCGAEFPKNENLQEKAGTDEVLASGVPEIGEYEVSRIIYASHTARSGNNSLKVNYYCGLTIFSEYVTLEAPGLPGKRARDWWRVRSRSEAYPPDSIFEAQQRTAELAQPKAIRVWTNKQFPEVVGYVW